MSVLCTICARGGSKGVPGKNIRTLAGLPLIAHTIHQARDSGCFKAIAVSSDSTDMLSVAREHGADYMIERPSELASDTAGKVGAIRHCQEQVELQSGNDFSTYVDLDATAPLRLVEDIREAIAILQRANCSSVISGSEARRSPYFNLVEAKVDGTVGLSKSDGQTYVRRQDVPACYDMNASIYVWNAEAFRQEPAVFYPDTRLLVMPEFRSVDVDHEIDFQFVELILEKKLHLEGQAYEA